MIMTTWFITGVSRGLGLALANAALARGDTVIGTVRSGTPPFTAPTDRLTLLTLDMTEDNAIAPVVERAFEAAQGRIDVIVNNAGYGLLGAIESASDEEVARLFAVDVFAPFRVMRAALPRLRAQRSGHIVNITSIAGRAPGAASGLYAAAKYALEGISASLAQEVAPAGIKVTAVAPGAFRTDFLAPTSIRKSTAESADYGDSVGKSTAALDAMAGRQLGDPVRAADAILKLVDDPNPPLQLLLGSDALRRARTRIDQMIEEMDRWEDVTRGTDFPEGV
jgi:NAD(P)-dependent dehydrogenase (short-subunit alcohol dehydrogenase family)